MAKKAKTQTSLNPLKVELKNVKFNVSLSDETNCFSAAIWVNGKKAGTVSNRGCGGSHEYHWDDREAGKRLEAWAEAQPTMFNFEKLDQLINDLFTADICRKGYKRLCAKQTIFRLQGDEANQTYRKIKAPFSAAVAAKLRAHHGINLRYIVNEDIEVAVQDDMHVAQIECDRYNSEIKTLIAKQENKVGKAASA